MHRIHLLDDPAGSADLIEVGDLVEFKCKHGNTGIDRLVERTEKSITYAPVRSHGCAECIGYQRGYSAAVREQKQSQEATK